MRAEIKRRGLSQYRIASDTGIKQPCLSRFVNGGSLKVETAAVLLDYLGFQLTLRAESDAGGAGAVAGTRDKTRLTLRNRRKRKKKKNRVKRN
jgi:transcriptional regulator with XRE-family HTH domain